jgi:peptidoglycan-associated lipoprotein
MKGKSIIPTLGLMCLSLLIFPGCAKKAEIKQDMTTQQQGVITDQKAKDAAAAKEKADRGKALPDQAMKDDSDNLKSMKTTKSKAGMAIAALADIHFDFDKYVLRPQDRDTLAKAAEWIKENHPKMVTIEGNCDERGTVEYNLALGQRRASEAEKYLVTLGVNEKILKAISYGKERPLDPGHDEEAWAKNRRDHFVVVTSGK